MITDAMVTGIIMHDSDGEQSLEVRHTVSCEIVVLRYGKQALGLGYDEARSLARALTFLMDQPEMKEDAQ